MRPVIATALLAIGLLVGCGEEEPSSAGDRPGSAQVQCPTNEPASSKRGGSYIIEGLDLDALDGPLLCRYEVDWDGESGGTYLLVDQRPMTEPELSRVAEAVKAAPIAESERDCTGGPGEMFAIYTPDSSTKIYNARCGHQGVRSADPELAYRATPQEALDILGSA